MRIHHSKIGAAPIIAAFAVTVAIVAVFAFACPVSARAAGESAEPTASAEAEATDDASDNPEESAAPSPTGETSSTASPETSPETSPSPEASPSASPEVSPSASPSATAGTSMPPESGGDPDTGDKMPIVWIVAALAAALVLVILAVSRGRHRTKKR